MGKEILKFESFLLALLPCLLVIWIAAGMLFLARYSLMICPLFTVVKPYWDARFDQLIFFQVAMFWFHPAKTVC